MDVFCIVNKTVKMSVPTQKTQLQQPLAYDNALAHSMRATVLNDDGTDGDLEGVGVAASMLRADGNTIAPIVGTVNGNVAEVVLPESCYLVPGRFKFTMNLTFGNASRTILWVEGYVERNVSGTIIDPGTPVGNISQAIASANAAATSATTAASAALEAAQEAEEYSESVAPDYLNITYPISAWHQVCWHEGSLYVNTVDIEESEEWTNAHWLATDISQLLNRRVATADVATVAEAKTYLGI